MTFTQFTKTTAVKVAKLNLVCITVNQNDAVVVVDIDAVRVGDIVAPTAQEGAVRGKYHHRRSVALRNDDKALTGNGQRTDQPQPDIVRQNAPRTLNAVTLLAHRNVQWFSFHRVDSEMAWLRPRLALCPGLRHAKACLQGAVLPSLLKAINCHLSTLLIGGLASIMI